MCECGDILRVSQILSRYSRAMDHRRPDDLDDVFTADVLIESFYDDDGAPAPLGRRLEGREAMKKAVAAFPTAYGRWHHLTVDHIVEIDGDTATLSAQFLTICSSPGTPSPLGSEFGLGAVLTGAAGYYDSALVRVDGQWLINRHHIIYDLRPPG
ncbi:nuclear transport factor 2 family protein [Actinomadura sp. KC345]|uniref:nuclear transport factor 2 family protein n=1 Tax=Actinomadura sp. KC345 TaxID=2530371 RepID=UPI0010497192|nr:nuclear transport factor 2 family protein [Actinomadura sp. KC345]TDC55624.1 nuclear transport factor 2 family protein [Actinomadura sp. KC345]